MAGKIRFGCGFIAIVFFAFCAFAHGGEWDKTIELSGRGYKQSNVFPLVGSKWRVKYSSKSSTNAKIEMVGKDGKVVVTVINYRKLETPYTATGKITPSMGDVYLRVNGDVNGWSCQLEQYVEEIGGWKIFKWRKDAADKKTEKFAMWSGDAGDEIEIPVTITAETTQVEFATYESGRVRIYVDDSEGQCHYMDCHLAAGKSRSWIYKPGDYVIRISSVGSSWSVSLDVEKPAMQISDMPGLGGKTGK